MSEPVKEPHAHDVLSGRGNFVNYHDGNEYFRKLVKKHKVEYVKCPKQKKGKFSKLIVDEIRARDPPGRFLKQDKDTKLWYDIGEKKALDKTRQALREGAPEIMNNEKQDNGEKAAASVNQTATTEQQQLDNSEYNMLQQSIMSIGTDSFSQGGMMSQNTFNGMGGNSNNLSGGMLSAPLYESPVGNDRHSSSNDNMLGNRTNGIDLSQMIPPPQIHEPNINMMQQQQMLLREQEQQLQREQERKWQELKLLQQQQLKAQLHQSQRRQFTSQQQEEILRNATAVMAADINYPQNNNMNFQHQPTTMHMDNLRINRLTEKRKLLEEQVLQQQQLEMFEMKKFQNQQKLNELKQQQHQHQQLQQQMQHQQEQLSSSEIRGALQSRLNAVYAGTDAYEPMPIGAPSAQPAAEGTLSGGNHSDGSSPRRRGPGLVRENSLKMESIFENDGDGDGDYTRRGSSGNTSGGSSNKKYNASIMSGMSMSATSLSMGFEEESQLSALFDTSMKLNHTAALNDTGAPSKVKGPGRHNETKSNQSLLGMSLGMSLGTIPGEKSSSSSMSTDSFAHLGDSQFR